MNRGQYLILFIVALAGGIIGGNMPIRLLPGLPAFAEKPPAEPLRVIAAEKFVVTDMEGNIRAVLGMVREAPALMMFGRDGSQPRLLMFDSKNCRAELSLRSDGEPRLNLFDGKNILRTAVGAVTIMTPETGKTKHLASAIATFDEKGRVLWSSPKPDEQ